MFCVHAVACGWVRLTQFYNESHEQHTDRRSSYHVTVAFPGDVVAVVWDRGDSELVLSVNGSDLQNGFLGFLIWGGGVGGDDVSPVQCRKTTCVEKMHSRYKFGLYLKLILCTVQNKRWVLQEVCLRVSVCVCVCVRVCGFVCFAVRAIVCDFVLLCVHLRVCVISVFACVWVCVCGHTKQFVGPPVNIKKNKQNTQLSRSNTLGLTKFRANSWWLIHGDDREVVVDITCVGRLSKKIPNPKPKCLRSLAAWPSSRRIQDTLANDVSLWQLFEE